MTADTLSLFSLNKQVAIVTGASRGIGAAIANGLLTAGAVVIGIARSDTPSDELSDDVDYRRCDVLDDNEFEGLCQFVFKKYGVISVLINCAGISMPLVEEKTKNRDNFRQTLEVNLVSVYNCCVAVQSYMKESGGGAIINITSINSIIGFPGNPGYVAAKGGARLLTKALALDLIADNIRVNAIAPGYIQTDMTKKSYGDSDLYNQRLKHMIIPRWGKPEDLVGAAVFLSSSASSYMTGQDIVVDGGWTAKGLIQEQN